MQLAAEEAHRVQTMKLSEFVSWLSEQGGMDDAVKTLSAEMSLAGFAAPSAHDLTLAAAMWSKKNYRRTKCRGNGPKTLVGGINTCFVKEPRLKHSHHSMPKKPFRYCLKKHRQLRHGSWS